MHPDIRINYQPVGSGAGIKQFTEGLVQFGASDAAMTDDQIAQVKEGVILLPMTAGSIVLSYNLPGVENLKLSRQAYVDMFLGKVTKWNDPEIAKANPGMKLPDTPVTIVHRSDGSGTTFVFTNHLSAFSEAWKNGPGANTTVNFPVGVGGKGNRA
jgi:phosphate transport system substrate-binding protein